MCSYTYSTHTCGVHGLDGPADIGRGRLCHVSVSLAGREVQLLAPVSGEEGVRGVGGLDWLAGHEAE